MRSVTAVGKTRAAAPGERIALASFVVGSLLAGGNAVGVRFSNRELDPFWGAGLRFGLATGLLVVLMGVLRLELPRGRALTGAVVYGALNFRRCVRAGALPARFAGRRALFRGGRRARAPVPACAPCDDQRGRHVDRCRTARGCLGGRRRVARAPPAHGDVGRARLPGHAGSILVFVLYVVVLRYWDASRAAYVFVVVPVVTVVLSAWLDDEPIRIGLVLGGIVVLAGVYIGALRPAHRQDRPSTGRCNRIT